MIFLHHSCDHRAPVTCKPRPSPPTKLTYLATQDQAVTLTRVGAVREDLVGMYSQYEGRGAQLQTVCERGKARSASAPALRRATPKFV